MLSSKRMFSRIAKCSTQRHTIRHLSLSTAHLPTVKTLNQLRKTYRSIQLSISPSRSPNQWTLSSNSLGGTQRMQLMCLRLERKSQAIGSCTITRKPCPTTHGLVLHSQGLVMDLDRQTKDSIAHRKALREQVRISKELTSWEEWISSPKLSSKCSHSWMQSDCRIKW